MYILGAGAEIGDLEDLVWVMEQLIDMETEQHNWRPACSFCPTWCRKMQTTRIWSADWRRRNDLGAPSNRRPGLAQSLRAAQTDAQAEPRAAWRSHTDNPARFRLSRAERESNLRATLLGLQAEQEKRRSAWRCTADGRGCCTLLVEMLGSTQQRAAWTTVVTLLSVFVTVLCATRMLVSQFAGTGDNIHKTPCHAGEGHTFAFYLVAYWTLVLVTFLGLLWRHLRTMELQRRSRPSRQPEAQPEPEPEPEPEIVYGARGHPVRMSADGSDDEYSSCGEDDPSWRSRRRQSDNR